MFCYESYYKGVNPDIDKSRTREKSCASGLARTEAGPKMQNKFWLE